MGPELGSSRTVISLWDNRCICQYPRDSYFFYSPGRAFVITHLEFPLRGRAANTNPSQAPASAVAPAHCNVTQCWPVQRGRGRRGGGRMRGGGPASPHSSWRRRRRWWRDDRGASCLWGVAPVARQYAAPVAGVGAGLPPLPRSAAAVARTERGSGRRPAGRLDRQAQQAASPSLRHAIQASAAGGSRVTRHARRQQVRCRRAGGCTASTALCRLLQTPARGFSEHVSNS